MSELGLLAQGRWHSILTAIGIEPHYLNGKHHDCPICKAGKDRFRFTDLNQKGGYFCSQCGHGDGFDLLQGVFGWDFKTAAQEVEKQLPGSVTEKPKQKKDPRILLRHIAKNSHPGVDVAGYLKGRGLKPDESLKQCSLDYFDDGKKIGRYVSMVALIVDKDRNPVSYHITYLNNQQKANVPSQKKVMPGVKSITGCAVRFGEGETIAVTEGIETALAVKQEYNKPVWAALNANNLEKLELPDFVKKVVIFADNDQNYTGQKSAYVLANRLSLKGMTAIVHIPKNTGEDFADELLRTA